MPGGVIVSITRIVGIPPHKLYECSTPGGVIVWVTWAPP